jgi:hypothetical protein
MQGKRREERGIVQEGGFVVELENSILEERVELVFAVVPVEPVAVAAVAAVERVRQRQRQP